MSNVSLIDGHIDNAEHCVCCGQVIPEGRQVCIICGKKVNGKQRQIGRIMKHLEKAPRKPLFDKKQGEIFIACIDDDIQKNIAQLIFVDGMTNEEVAEQIHYSKRQIERIQINLMKSVLQKLIKKHIPTKGSIKYLSSYTDDPPVLLCPNCQEHIPTEGCNFYKYCYKCGQALDWSDTE